MELVKKNILSIICGVVALAAIVFHFAYTRGHFSTLETEAKARADKAGVVTGLLKEDRAWPAVTDAAPAKLDRFPNPPTIQAAEGLTTQLHAEVTKLMTKAVEINRDGYDLLVPGSLPRPNDPQKYDFRDAYNAVLTPGGKPKAYDPNRPLVNLPDGLLKSAVPPTDQEIAQAKVALWKELYAPKIIVVNNAPVNLKEIVADYKKALAGFDEKFKRDRATNYKVYLEPGALAIKPSLYLATARAAPSVEDMWYGQMSYWIQQDVCRAVARMNERSASIPTSPVKHLVKVDVKQDGSMYARGAATAAAAPSAEGGGAPAADPNAKNFALSPTGRMCNPIYDVVHFDVRAVVDAAVVKEFVRMLQYGRFINVVKADMQVVDLAEAVDTGYDYGSRPVVELTLKCEALFLREWTVQKNGPMPLPVQQFLGIGPATPNPAAPPAGEATETAAGA